MSQLLTLSQKDKIIDDFNNYTSWIDDIFVGASIVNDLNYQKAKQHGIARSDIISLFWENDPFASEANKALDILREKYCKRMQEAFISEKVTNTDEYDSFIKTEQKLFKDDWEKAIDKFNWGKIQKDSIEKLLNNVKLKFPKMKTELLRRRLIKLYPNCSAYDASTEEAVIRIKRIA